MTCVGGAPLLLLIRSRRIWSESQYDRYLLNTETFRVTDSLTVRLTTQRDLTRGSSLLTRVVSLDHTTCVPTTGIACTGIAFTGIACIGIGCAIGAGWTGAAAMLGPVYSRGSPLRWRRCWRCR